MHVHGLCTLRFVVVDDLECGAVVSLNGSLGLLVAHLFEKLARRYGFAGIDL
jgi:hypothetical protein